jgi:hypothetical protein
MPAESVPQVVALVSLEELRGYVLDSIVGIVMATGSSPYDAVESLERRAVQLARESHARHVGDPRTVPHQYAVLGLRFAGGVSASGQPEWTAYGTLARGFREASGPE